MLKILLKRKVTTITNTLLALRGWKLGKNLIFAGVGLTMLAALYGGFWRLLSYLEGVQLIGPMLSWKLTSMVLLMTFSMIIVSSIIISMTTLYYSSDLKFLFSCPLDLRAVFLDKSFETVFYSSWTLVLAILPYIMALGRVKALGAGFYLSYAMLMVPFVMLAGAVGILFSMLVMYSFPTSRTRDITWLLGSLSVAFVYVAFRFSKPEQLLRPDSLQVVAQYIEYLQSPTAPYMPSWWVTRAMVAYSAGHWLVFSLSALVLSASAAAIYAFIYYLSGFLYMRGFSGAQGSPRFSGGRETLFEQRLAFKWPALSASLTLYWKDRLALARDARYWSQIILIAALIAVYLFSIRQLPLDTPDLKSLVSFLNVGVAGFVVAAIGLRFTFPANARKTGVVPGALGADRAGADSRLQPPAGRGPFYFRTVDYYYSNGFGGDLRYGDRPGRAVPGFQSGEHPPAGILLRRLHLHGLRHGVPVPARRRGSLARADALRRALRPAASLGYARGGALRGGFPAA